MNFNKYFFLSSIVLFCCILNLNSQFIQTNILKMNGMQYPAVCKRSSECISRIVCNENGYICGIYFKTKAI